MEGNIDLLPSAGIRAELNGGSHDDRAVVVGCSRSFTSVPDEATAVGKDASGDSRAIVTTPADQHHSRLAHLPVHLEVVDRLLWGCHILAAGGLGNGSGAVNIFAPDLTSRIGDVWRLDSEEFLWSIGRSVAVHAVPVHVPDPGVRVWCHLRSTMTS